DHAQQNQPSATLDTESRRGPASRTDKGLFITTKENLFPTHKILLAGSTANVVHYTYPTYEGGRLLPPLLNQATTRLS
ncbi:hypothetical protein ACJBSU_10520, partial [Streptococcus suis]